MTRRPAPAPHLAGTNKKGRSRVSHPLFELRRMTHLRPHFPGLKPGPSDVSSIGHTTWSPRLPKGA